MKAGDVLGAHFEVFLLKLRERSETFERRHYRERYRNGEKIASGFVESAINQVVSKRMVKKQQMEMESAPGISRSPPWR